MNGRHYHVRLDVNLMVVNVTRYRYGTMMNVSVNVKNSKALCKEDFAVNPSECARKHDKDCEIFNKN